MKHESLAQALTIIGLTLVLSFPVFAVRFPSCAGVVGDPDVWWHLRAADWIAAHSNVPQFDPFSAARTGPVAADTAAPADQRVPWVDYSWLAELVLNGFYAAFGLRGLVFYTALLAFATVLTFYFLLRGMQQDLIVGAVLAVLLTLGLLPATMPRPWMFSILFFVVELHILLEAGRRPAPVVAARSIVLGLGEHAHPVHLRPAGAGGRGDRTAAGAAALVGIEARRASEGAGSRRRLRFGLAWPSMAGP